MLQTYTVLFAQANIAILNKKKVDNMLFDCFFKKKKKTSIQDKPSRPKHAWAFEF